MRKTRNKTPYVFVILLVAAAVWFFPLQSFGSEEPAGDIAYTHGELAELIEQNAINPASPDYTPLYGGISGFEADGQSLQTAEGVTPGPVWEAALQAFLTNKIFISSTLYNGGVLIVTAYDTQTHSVAVAGVNLTGDAQSVSVGVERLQAMPFETESFNLVADVETPAPASVPPEDSEAVPPPAGTEGETEETSPADEGAAPDGAANPEEASPTPEAPVSQPAEPTVPTAAKPVDPVVTGFHLESAGGDSGGDTTGPVALSLSPHGFSTLRMETGLLRGGPLSANPKLRAQIGGLTLNSGTENPANGTHGLLRLYSMQDPLPGGAAATGDWATYSLTSHAVQYTVDSSSEIVVNNRTSATNAHFTVELCNSQIVQVMRVDGQVLTGSNGYLHFTAGNGAAAPMLVVENPTGTAIRYDQNIDGRGPATVYAWGGDYGLYSTRSGSTIQLREGFVMEAAAGTYGVYHNGNQNMAGDGKLIAYTLNNGNSAVYVNNTLTVTNLHVETADAQVGINCNVLNTSGAIITASGSNTGINVRDDMKLENASSVTADAQDGGGTAISVNDNIEVRSLSLLKGHRAATGILCNDLMTFDGSLEYGTAQSETDTAKTRVVADASDTGIRVKSDNEIGAGSIVISTGVNIGYYGEHFTEGNMASRQYGTLIAHGTGPDSIGLSNGTRYKYFCYGIRVVAVGGKYGNYCPGSYDYIIRDNSQFIAIGGVDGFNVNNSFYPNRGSFVYARGGAHGIRNATSFVTSFNQSKVVAIGGVDDEHMEDSPFRDADHILNNPFQPDDLPHAKPDEKGVLPFKEGTYGIRNTSGSYIESENTSEMYAYGGEWGAFAGSFFEVSSDSRMELCGGRVGGQASSYMWFYSSNNIFKASGRETGLLTGSYINYSTGNNNYLYGYGEKNGVNAATYITLSTNCYLVGETLADGTEGLPASDPLAQPAVKCERSSSSITIPNGSIMHELYTVQNYNVTTLPPYPINQEIDAVGANMGTNPATLPKLDWTTPRTAPQRAADGRDYLNYDPGDDQKLMKAGTADGVTGLIAYGSMQNATLVGQSTGSARDMVSGATNNTISSSSGTSSKYRITLQLVNVEDLSTMNVRLNFQESFGTERFPLASLPPGTLYEVTFESIFGDAPQPIEVTEDGPPDPSPGTILLAKLREGRYTLRPKQDVGWPYCALPEVVFEVYTDTSAEVPAGQNYDRYWHKKVRLVGTGRGDEGDIFAEVTEAGKSITDGSGTEDPAFTPTDERFDVDAKHTGTIDLVYERIRYKLDLKLLDAESREHLPGQFTVQPRLDGAVVPGLADSVTVVNGGTAAEPQWPYVNVYAGLTYTFTQDTAGLEGYIKAGGDYTVTVTEGDGTAPALRVDGDNAAYETEARAEEPYFSVYALNDLPIVETTLNLIDDADFIAQPQVLTPIPGGAFRLEVRYRDGSTADITDTAVVDNHNGTFTLRLRPQRDSYYLTQTFAPDYNYHEYQRRRSTNRFAVEDITYDPSDGTVTGYRLDLVSTSGGDGGWVEPDGYDEKSIWITNVSPATVGGLTVRVNTTGLWRGNGEAVFLVELRSTDPSFDKVFYEVITITGSGDIGAHSGAVRSGSVEFDPVPMGEYTVTVYPSLHAGGPIQSQVESASVNRETIAVFDFNDGTDSYYTSEGVLVNEFLIEDAATP